MSNLYMWHIEVTVGARKFSSKEVTVEFDIPFDDGPDINIAEVDIYNLSGSTIAALKKGDKIVVNAGYNGDIGAVLVGTLQLVYTDWPGVDKITQLTVADAHDDWMQANIKKTYKEGITGLQILNDLIPKTGLSIGALKLPLNMQYDGAKTVDGKIGKIVVEIAKDCNAKAHVNRGKIYIREKSEGDEIAFVLDKDHGLIGSPTPIEQEEKYKVVERVKKEGQYVNEYVQKTRIRKGYKVKSLLNFNFTTDVVLKIQSKTANGLFRIEKGNHIANTSSYFTEMEVYPA